MWQRSCAPGEGFQLEIELQLPILAPLTIVSSTGYTLQVKQQSFPILYI